MNDREVRRERRVQRFQTLAFLGTFVILGMVLFVSLSAQSERRDRERARQTAAALPTSEPVVPTARDARLRLIVPADATPYPWPGDYQSVESFCRPGEECLLLSGPLPYSGTPGLSGWESYPLVSPDRE